MCGTTDVVPYPGVEVVVCDVVPSPLLRTIPFFFTDAHGDKPGFLCVPVGTPGYPIVEDHSRGRSDLFSLEMTGLPVYHEWELERDCGQTNGADFVRGDLN